MARAIETRCRWPPESFTPRSPMMVSYFCSYFSANSSTRAMAQARRISSSVASGLEKATFSRIDAVEEKRILQHHAQLRAIRLQPHRGEIDAIDQHFAFVRLVEGGNQSDDGRLA